MTVLLQPDRDLSLELRLTEVDDGSGGIIPLPVGGSLSAYLATSDAPGAPACDMSLAAALTYVRPGLWLLRMDRSVLTQDLLHKHFGIPVRTRSLVSDEPGRADSAVTLGNATTGQLWATFGGPFGIAAKRFYSPSTDGTTIDMTRAAYIDGGVAGSVRVSVTVNTLGLLAGLALSYASRDDLLAVLLSPTQLYIVHRLGGYPTVTTVVPYVGVDGDKIEVARDAVWHTITVLVNGVIVAVERDVTVLEDATQHGIVVNDSTARMSLFDIASAQLPTPYLHILYPGGPTVLPLKYQPANFARVL